MEMIGLRILMQRDPNKPKLSLEVPDWIAAKLGDLFIVEYDGFRLSVWPAENIAYSVARKSKKGKKK